MPTTKIAAAAKKLFGRASRSPKSKQPTADMTAISDAPEALSAAFSNSLSNGTTSGLSSTVMDHVTDVNAKSGTVSEPTESSTRHEEGAATQKEEDSGENFESGSFESTSLPTTNGHFPANPAASQTDDGISGKVSQRDEAEFSGSDLSPPPPESPRPANVGTATLDLVQAAVKNPSKLVVGTESFSNDSALPETIENNGTVPEELVESPGGDDELSDGDDNESRVDQKDDDDVDDVDRLITAYVEGQTQTYGVEVEEPRFFTYPEASDSQVATPAEQTDTPADVDYFPAERVDTPAEQAGTPANQGDDAVVEEGEQQASADNETTVDDGKPTQIDIKTVVEVETKLAEPTGDSSQGHETGADINEAEAANDLDGETVSNPKPKKRSWDFKKLTGVNLFKDYLANPAEMSYDKLYHRTEVVANVMQQYQDEFDEISKELNDYDVAKKIKAKEVEEELKVGKEKAQKKEDKQLIRLWIKFEDIIKGLRLSEFHDFRENFSANYPEETDPNVLDLIAKLRNQPTEVRKLIKQRDLKKNNAAAKPKQLIEQLHNGMTKAETRALNREIAEEKKERENAQRKILIDPEKFEDRKQADVYGYKYSDKPEHIGNQPLNLADRHDADPLNPPGQRRTRNKRKNYDTEDATPAASEEEILPAKRARVPRFIDDGLGVPDSLPKTSAPSPGREGRPRTFPSGKRIGRPKGSKTKSKLSVLAAANDGNGVAEVALPVQSLVAAEEGAAPEVIPEYSLPLPPPKKKHAGGRPKGSGLKAKKAEVAAIDQVVFEAGPAVEKLKPNAKAKANGRGKKKQAPGDDVEEPILPSTEQIDEGPSRPSTSSSTNTTSAPRQTRSATRERSQTANPEQAAGPRANKRKRSGDNTINVVAPIKEEDEPPTPAPVTKKRKTAAASAASAPASKNPRKRKVAEPVIEDEDTTAPTAPALKRPGTKKVGPKTSLEDDESDFNAQPVRAKKAKPKSALKASEGEESEFQGITGSEAEVINPNPRKCKAAVPSPEQIIMLEAAPVAKRARVGLKNGKGKTKREEDIESDFRTESGSGENAVINPRKRKAATSVPTSQNVTGASINNKKLKGPRRAASNKSKKFISESEESEFKAETDLDTGISAAENGFATAGEEDTPVEVAPLPAKRKPGRPRGSFNSRTGTRLKDSEAAPPVAQHASQAGSTGIRKSTRPRKETRRAMGLDGAGDTSSEDEDDSEDKPGNRFEKVFRSEYEHYQALTSPGSGVNLGKRARKTRVDLSAFGEDGSEDDLL